MGADDDEVGLARFRCKLSGALRAGVAAGWVLRVDANPQPPKASANDQAIRKAHHAAGISLRGMHKSNAVRHPSVHAKGLSVSCHLDRLMLHWDYENSSLVSRICARKKRREHRFCVYPQDFDQKVVGGALRQRVELAKFAPLSAISL